MSQSENAALGIERVATRDDARRRQAGWFAAGGVAGAVLASACCIVPFVLVTLGVSGAWIGNLTALEPYKPYTLTMTAIVLGAGFWHVYLRPKEVCADGTYCARPSSSRITKVALWGGTLLAVASATISIWAPLLY